MEDLKARNDEDFRKRKEANDKLAEISDDLFNGKISWKIANERGRAIGKVLKALDLEFKNMLLDVKLQMKTAHQSSSKPPTTP